MTKILFYEDQSILNHRRDGVAAWGDQGSERQGVVGQDVARQGVAGQGVVGKPSRVWRGSAWQGKVWQAGCGAARCGSQGMGGRARPGLVTHHPEKPDNIFAVRIIRRQRWPFADFINSEDVFPRPPIMHRLLGEPLVISLCTRLRRGFSFVHPPQGCNLTDQEPNQLQTINL